MRGRSLDHATTRSTVKQHGTRTSRQLRVVALQLHGAAAVAERAVGAVAGQALTCKQGAQQQRTLREWQQPSGNERAAALQNMAESAESDHAIVGQRLLDSGQAPPRRAQVSAHVQLRFEPEGAVKGDVPRQLRKARVSGRAERAQ